MPENINMQAQIDQLNRKMDLILEELTTQRQKREEVEDLIGDLSLIGNDAVQVVTKELHKAGVQMDTEVLAQIGLKVVHNLDNINDLMSMLESANDLVKDVSPIVLQAGIEATSALNDLDQKGYITFIKELKSVADNIVAHFTEQDIKDLAANIVTILETVKRMTQPDMLEAANNAIGVYKNMDTTNLPEYTMWKAFKEMRTPEMRKGLGFMITFLKNMANTEANK